MRRSVLIASMLIGSGIATPLPSLSAQTPEAGRGPTDPVELGAFLDGWMIAQMKNHDIVGATVAVVRDGRLLFSKGYGYADWAQRTPVDPATTMFLIGSVTKLFTWTAVMQLVEQGKLDLHADVNDYLDFRIPDTYPGQPITVWNLMTHTPGFEDRAFGLFSRSTEPRGAFLAAHIPARVRPPGQYSAYSNYGAALAGYIVERVSGESWAHYVQAHILDPLGMRHAAMEQPLPAELKDDLSVGYQRGGGAPKPGAPESIVPFAPAGIGSATAEDMARFMIAQLQDGEYEGQRILADSTARLMHTRQFAHDPRLPGFDLGFYEQDSHGVHIIGHGGDTQWFHSDLSLFPADSLGVFVSFNTLSGGKVSFGPFLDQFLDHYFPEPPAPPASAADSAAAPDVSAYVGPYRLNRMSYTTVEKVMGLLAKMSVTKDDANPGGIVVVTPFGKRHYVPAGPNLFRQVDGAERVAFQLENGRATHFFVSDAPMMAGERVAWYQAATFSRILLVVAMLLFLTAVLAPPARWLLRKRFGQIPTFTGRARTARWVQFAVAALAIVAVVVLAAALSNTDAYVAGHAGMVYFALTLTTLTAVATLALLWYTVVVWREKLADRWARIHYTAVALGAVGLAYVLVLWNLVGWRV
ncbi:MAG: beta-lactamase family protein [Gemmatimonadetes bacterium]|nr:beta-lactamase family protein [Gemmatimonadota bacterium]